jgi:hypothetical protein
MIKDKLEKAKIIYNLGKEYQKNIDFEIFEKMISFYESDEGGAWCFPKELKQKLKEKN